MFIIIYKGDGYSFFTEVVRDGALILHLRPSKEAKVKFWERKYWYLNIWQSKALFTNKGNKKNSQIFEGFQK